MPHCASLRISIERSPGIPIPNVNLATLLWVTPTMTKKLLKIFLATLVFAALLMVGWYQIDGIPTEGTTAYMSGAGYAVAETEDGALLFTPSASNGYGIAMMHGALILPQSYAKSAAYFAKLGYTVYLPSGPARLSIGAVDSTAQYIQESALDGWFFIGHSMGGMSSLETISRHRIDARAVALWATAMPSDYSDVEAPILFIWGDSDGLP